MYSKYHTRYGTVSTNSTHFHFLLRIDGFVKKIRKKYVCFYQALILLYVKASNCVNKIFYKKTVM